MGHNGQERFGGRFPQDLGHESHGGGGGFTSRQNGGPPTYVYTGQASRSQTMTEPQTAPATIQSGRYAAASTTDSPEPNFTQYGAQQQQHQQQQKHQYLHQYQQFQYGQQSRAQPVHPQSQKPSHPCTRLFPPPPPPLPPPPPPPQYTNQGRTTLFATVVDSPHSAQPQDQYPRFHTVPTAELFCRRTNRMAEEVDAGQLTSLGPATAEPSTEYPSLSIPQAHTGHALRGTAGVPILPDSVAGGGYEDWERRHSAPISLAMTAPNTYPSPVGSSDVSRGRHLETPPPASPTSDISAGTTTPSKQRQKANPHQCQYCGRWVKVLSRHIQDVHSVQPRQFRCPVVGCPRAEDPFRRNDNLTQHLRSVHKQPIARQKKGRARRASPHSSGE